jgi:hypothetical protein
MKKNNNEQRVARAQQQQQQAKGTLPTALGANVLLVRHQPWRELHDTYADAPSATRVALGPTSLTLGASPATVCVSCVVCVSWC